MSLSLRKLYVFFAIISATLFISNCKSNFGDAESFAPANLDQAVISSITANGGGALYCSISGGCPMVIKGKNFFKTAKVYIGSFLCLDTVRTSDTEMTCTVGPGQSGVHNVTVVNADGKVSIIDPVIADPTTLQFSYASFLYLGSQETPGKVHGYAQHPTTGALINLIGSPYSITGHNGTYGVVIHPNNKFVYSANVSNGTVSTYSINPQTGRLTAVGTPLSSGAGAPNGLFFHPSGNFLYVTNQAGNSVTGFSVATNGELTLLAGSPFATTGSSGINGVVVSADGHFLYAATMGGNGGVAGFTIDQTTGALTLIPGSPFVNTAGGDTTNPGDGISIHPNGRWIYMGLFSIGKISGWNIDQSTGALSPIEAPTANNAPAVFPDGGGSASTVSKDGLFLYGTAFSGNGADPKKIVVYSIDQTTGGLTRVSNVDTGGGPNDVRIDTNGSFAYTCNSRNPASVSAFSVDKVTGALSPLTPRDYAIPGAPPSGPGIMVIQRNL